jgi:hypothetical protein
MTWPELVARELAARDRSPLVVTPDEPMTCAMCERWACVVIGAAGTPDFCLSCWYLLATTKKNTTRV